MLHSLSPAALTPNAKKRKVSITKKSGQKPSIHSPTQSTTKLSHKQNKQKILAMQNHLDEQQYKASVKKLFLLNDRSFLQALDQGKFQQASGILQQVKSIIDSTIYGPNKKHFYNHLSIYHCNKAYVLQQLGESQQSAKQMQSSIKNFQNAQGYILSRQENLAHTSEWVKLNLQYFTTLSNVNKHLEAIVSAQKCIQKISQSFRVLDAMCAENLIYSDTPETIATQSESRVKSQKVNFKRIVVKQAQKILKSIDISSPHKLITENKQKFQQKCTFSIKLRKNMYFWKTNMQNNAKLAQKQLLQKGKQPSSIRNLLGVQKTSNFTQEFSLGELMNLSTKRMKQKLNIDQYFLLSSPKIVELILFASVCYFTLATQTRFKEIETDINTLKITQKYQRLNKDEIIFKCKVLHLKAIELAAKHLPETNSYFTHILNSFNKNYKSILDEINEQSQSSMKSYNKSLEKLKMMASMNSMECEMYMRKIIFILAQKRKRDKLHKKMEKLQKTTLHENNMIKPAVKKRITSKDKQTLSKRKVSTNKKSIN